MLQLTENVCIDILQAGYGNNISWSGYISMNNNNMVSL